MIKITHFKENPNKQQYLFYHISSSSSEVVPIKLYMFILSKTEGEFGASARSESPSYYKGDNGCFQEMIGRG